MHNKDILFLISLPTDVKTQMKISYTKYINILRSIERIELRESISQGDLAIADQFPLVVIVGHNNVSEESLILENGTLLPWTSIVSDLPVSCTNTIDIGACKAKLGEKSVADAIKEHCPNTRRVLSPKTDTKVEGRLMLYTEMLPSIDLNKDYYEVYCSKIVELKQRIIQLREWEKGQTETLQGTNLGTMSTSAVPKTISRNSTFHVKAYIREDGEEVDIIAEIGDYRRHNKRNLILNNGDIIVWDLSFNTNPYPDFAKRIEGAKKTEPLIWDSHKPIDYTFECFFPSALDINSFSGTLTTIINDKEVDTWLFPPINVIPYQEGDCNNIVSISDDENKNKDKSFMNVNEVKVKLEYEGKNLDELKKYIEDQKHEVISIHSLGAPELQQDYNDLENEIIILKKYSERDLFNKKKHLFLYDQRLFMLKQLKVIHDIVESYEKSKRKTTNNDRLKIRDHATKFFDAIELYKIDFDIYDIIKKVYKNDKDSFMSPLYSREVRKAYNGLAIKMAYKTINNDCIYKYTYYEADKKNDSPPIADDTWTHRRQYVQTHVIKYIEKLLKDTNIKLELERYLEREPSSIIAIYLMNLYD